MGEGLDTCVPLFSNNLFICAAAAVVVGCKIAQI